MYGSETHPIPSRNKSSKSRMSSLVGKNEDQSQVCNKENKNNVYSPPAVTKVHFQSKRQGYLSWDDYFLAVALLSSKRSKDPKSPSGACIVDQHNRIVGIGYNGFPRGCSDDIFPWDDGMESDKELDWLHTKAPYVCQAVTNAILNKCSNDVAGCRIYVMEYPDSESAKVIIQSGIREVVVLGEDRMPGEGSSIRESFESTASVKTNEDMQASQILLEMAGVTVRSCRPKFSSLTLDFLAKLSPETWTAANAGDTNDNMEEQEGAVRSRNYSEKVGSTTNLATKLLLEEAKYDASKIADNGKRNNFISWQDYFMAMAFLTAQRSKDPNTQVGACIVDADNKIIGLGYNGFPSGCHDDCLPWARSNKNALHNKYLYVCHAEVNAILNKGSANVKGSSIYVALFPCENCAKMIIQAGIREVVFMSDAYHDAPGTRASRIMFQCAGVKLRQYIPTMQKLDLDFENL